MKLYEVPRNSRIKVRGLELDVVLHFVTIDGAYSVCKDANNLVVHLSASAEVDIVSNDTPLTKVTAGR